MQYIWLLLSVVLVGIDRLTKWAIVSNMQLHDKINLLQIGDTEVLNIYYCTNNGAAFSSMSGKTTLLIVLTSAVLFGLLVMMIMKKVKRPVNMAAFSLIIGGGLGNLIDRIFNEGRVVDFIDVRLINFPIFNFADICAVVGAVMLFISLLVEEIGEHRRKKQAGASAEITDSAESSSEASDSNGEN